MSDEITNVVGYCRVSTFDQVREGNSLDIQESAIRRYVDYKGLTLLDMVADPGVSGTVPLKQRKGGKRVWALATEGGCGVVVYKIDRLGRSAIDILQNAEAFPALHILDLQVDTTTPVGKLILRVMASFAEMERDMIAERVRDGVAKARENGKRIGQPPYGYRVDDNGVMERDPDQWTVVEHIVNLRQNSWTYERIADSLNAEGVETKQSARWKPVSVQRVCLRATKEGLL